MKFPYMDQKPTTVWLIILIVAGVGLYYILYRGLYIALAGGFSIIFAMFPIALGVLTLLIAFLIFSGSNGGKTFLTIILVFSILGNLMSIMLIAFLQDYLLDMGIDPSELGTSYIEPLIFLVLALVTFVLLYRPEVKAYFKNAN